MNARQKILDQIAAADEDSSDLGSDSSDPEIQHMRIQAYSGVVQQYQSLKVARNENLKNLNKLVGRLMEKGNIQVGT